VWSVVCVSIATCTLVACGRVDFDDMRDGAAVAADVAVAADAGGPPRWPTPPGSRTRRSSTFADTFSSGQLTDLWTPAGPCVDQVGGELVSTPPASGLYCHAWAHGSYHLTCDSVTVRVPEVTNSTLGVQTFIYVHQPSASGQLQLLLEGGGFQIGNGTFYADAGPYDPVNDVWWRLRERDGELFFETSPDGQTWSIRVQAADPMPFDDVEIAIGAGTWQFVASPGRARFHCYNVPPPCL
jgi:hypothetical protein